MDELTALIQARMSPSAEIEQTLEQYVGASIIAFRDRFRHLTETNPVVKRTKIQDHVASIVSRLLVTSRMNREITYSELYKAMSQRIRNKFDIALIILVKEQLVIENTKRGKCYYKLNALFPQEPW